MQAPAQTQESTRRSGPEEQPAPKVPPEFDALPIWKMDAQKLVAMVKDPNSTLFQKAIACKRLSIVGGREAVQPMAALLSHPQLACYARFGMEPNPDPSVDDAFRAALPKLQGKLQVGVIHSIGFRKDAKALDALSKLIQDSDPEVAGAAAGVGGDDWRPSSRPGAAIGVEEHEASTLSGGGPSLPAVRRGTDGKQPCAGPGVIHRIEREVDARAGTPVGASRAECRGTGSSRSEELAGADRRGGRGRSERFSGTQAPVGTDRASSPAPRPQYHE